MLVSVTLTDPVSGLSVPIMPQPGVAVTSLEVEPVVRGVVNDRVDANGTVDSTLYLSEATVTLELLLYDATGTTPSQAAFLDQIGPLLNPRLRPWLIVADQEWAAPRQLTVRLGSMSKVRTDPTNWPVQINWVAPDGVWESAVQETASIPPFIPATTGLDISSSGLDISHSGLDMPASTNAAEFIVGVDGTADTPWVIRLYGPCTGPKIANDTTGMTLEFTDALVLGAGQYVELTMVDRSAYLESDPSQSQLLSLIFATSNWAPLRPGQNLVRFYPTSAGSGAEAVVIYRSASAP